MKLLLDSCVWGGVHGELSIEGHDVTRVSDYGPDPGDHAIIQLARREGRVLVRFWRTRDPRWLGPIAALSASWTCHPECKAPGASMPISLGESDLASAAIVTVEPRRIRVRPGGKS